MNFITQDVLYTSGDIKRESKAQLKGHWRSAIILMLIPTVFSIIFIGDTAQGTMNRSLLGDLIVILLNVVHNFLLTGVTFTFLDFLRRYDEYIDPLRGVIQAFRKEYLLNLFILKVTIYIRIFLWTLLLIIPGIVKAYSYSQAELVYKDTVDRTGEQPSPKECIDESQRLMQGHKMELFTLDISFIGWFILGIFTLGILYLWLIPYYTMSQVVFYENLAGTRYSSSMDTAQMGERDNINPVDPYEEVGQDPDDFRDFEDF
ncbi:DUF975 family protein [Carnobacteriaceae bacterium 52-44]